MIRFFMFYRLFSLELLNTLGITLKYEIYKTLSQRFMPEVFLNKILNKISTH